MSLLLLLVEILIALTIAKDSGRPFPVGDTLVYQPALRPDQIKALYYLKKKLARPMTELARDAIDDYLSLTHMPRR